MRALAAIAIAACGGASAPPVASGPPAALVAAPASADDVVVATVEGRPVYGSCVAAQAARFQLSAVAARAQCIDFELLAQAAERRGLATAREVVDATHAVLAGKVARGYEQTLVSPSDFGAAWDKVTKAAIYKHKHLEYRASAFVAVMLPRKPAPTPTAEASARALAEQIAAAVAGETGLLPPHLRALAERAAPGHPIVAATESLPPGTLAYQVVPPLRQHATHFDWDYLDALFAIPELGRASPAVRTETGWNVIAWTGVVPAAEPSPDELVRALLPDVQQKYFPIWVGQLAKQLGIRPTYFEDNLAKLDEHRAAPPPPAPPAASGDPR